MRESENWAMEMPGTRQASAIRMRDTYFISGATSSKLVKDVKHITFE
jgi:hypothetical protein